MEFDDYSDPRRTRFRDDSPVTRDTYYSDGDGNDDYVVERHYRSQSRSPSPYRSQARTTDTIEVAETSSRNRVSFDTRCLPPLSESYIERLERENRVLHQQLQCHLSPNHLSSRLASTEETLDDARPAHNASLAMAENETGQRSFLQGQDDVSPVTPRSSGPVAAVKRLKRKEDRYGEFKLVVDIEAEFRSRVHDLGHRNVITVIRNFDRNKTYWHSTIDLFSPAVTQLKNYMPQLLTNLNPVDDQISFVEPFWDLFYNRQGLIKAVESDDWRDITNGTLLEARMHVQLLLEYMRNDLYETTRKMDDLESSSPSNMITYPELWMLYQPGTIVYSREKSEYEAFVVDSMRGFQKRQRSSGSSYPFTRLDLNCFSIDYDGEAFGRVWTMHCISPFHGEKEIESLDLVPAKFLPNAPHINEALLKRGKEFYTLQGQQYREYVGDRSSNDVDQIPERVMVDQFKYQRRHDWPIVVNRKQGPSGEQFADHDRLITVRRSSWDDDWSPPRRRGRKRSKAGMYVPPIDDARDYSPDRAATHEYPQSYQRYSIDRPAKKIQDGFEKFDEIDPSTELDEVALLLCPKVVHGFCLRKQVWKPLNVNKLRSVAFRGDSWNRLVLDTEYKNIIQAMVSSYIDKTARLDDLVNNKGQGLTLLLHGPPGSGKSLTAECVAEAYSKPLYQVTCGDLGTDEDDLEKRLSDIFDYAVTWGAILLLDEADIFLQDRDMNSLKRNALVSVFLRMLDYFSGILFLTTNRVSTFDQAFQSRIHVTLGVPTLDQKRRVQVWDIFLDDLATKSAIDADKHKQLKGLVREKWSKERLNGRQIRNAMRTALVVAEKNGTVIGEGEVGIVLRIGREFEGYLGHNKGVQGGLEGFEEVVEP